MNHRLDIIGDIHGHLDALESLGQHLGYDVENGWTHRDGRVLVFLGNLIDGGDHSLEVSELVLSLVGKGRALCLMGNHEYNLVRYNLGLEKRNQSNEKTVNDLGQRRSRWAPVLAFFRDLPLAIELPELRLIHAMWHRQHYGAVGEIIRPRRQPSNAADPINTLDEVETAEWLRRHVALETPFDDDGLRRGLPTTRPPGQEHLPHEILIKGEEESADAPFVDSDGEKREMLCRAWWLDVDATVPRDKVTVFGHYRNLPPIPRAHDDVVPPRARSDRQLRAWQAENAALVFRRGTVDVAAAKRFVCVDYSGVERGGGCPAVGAYRWPEHQVAWAEA